LGVLMSTAGDGNDDGMHDLIINARVNGDFASNAGASYLLYGSTSLASLINAGSSDVTFQGKVASSTLYALSGVGDVNNDGFPDVFLGEYNNDDIGADAGAAYIVFGTDSLSSTIQLNGPNVNVTIQGKAAGDNLGVAAGGGRMNPGP
ncbi:MAG: hypothetical protein AAB309_07730, partial [Deltaproteobacteria bacterium]